MRLGRPQKLMACVLAALCLANGNIWGQQAGSQTSLPVGVIAGNSREVEARASEAKRPATAAISLKSLVTEALEQNPEIIAMRRNFDMMRARAAGQSAAGADAQLRVYGKRRPAPAFRRSEGRPFERPRARP